MLESLQHTAWDAKHEKKAYYRFVRHYAREEIKVSKRYIKILVLRLLGDKDYVNIFEISAKVTKQFRKEHDKEDREYSQYSSRQRVNRGKRSTETSRCFFYIEANFPERKEQR